MKTALLAFAILALAASCSKIVDPVVGRWTSIYYPDGWMESYFGPEKLTLELSSSGTFTLAREVFYLKHTKGINDSYGVRKSAPLGESGTWSKNASGYQLTWKDGSCNALLDSESVSFIAISVKTPIRFGKPERLKSTVTKLQKLIVGEWDFENRGKKVTYVFSEDGTMKTIAGNRVENKRFSIDGDQLPVTLVLTEDHSIYGEGGREIPTTMMTRLMIDFPTDGFMQLMEPNSERPLDPKYTKEQLVFRRVK